MANKFHLVNGTRRHLNLTIRQEPPPIKTENFQTPKTSQRLVDLRRKMPPVWDQGSLGSCTAFATLGCFMVCDPSWNGSRLFQYYNARIIDDGDATDDDGATMWAAARAICQYGVCHENTWPYVPSKHAIKPPDACFKEGSDHQAVTVSVVQQTEAQIKAALQGGFPLMFGFLVFSGFLKIGRNGIMQMPTRREYVLGGHAVVCCGYDDTRRVWICRNSWGKGWGDNGYFYMPYAYLTNRNFCEGLYKITKVEL